MYKDHIFGPYGGLYIQVSLYLNKYENPSKSEVQTERLGQGSLEAGVFATPVSGYLLLPCPEREGGEYLRVQAWSSTP